MPPLRATGSPSRPSAAASRCHATV
jgi:hypothetical protein